jgi:hypothetical protein
MASPLHDLYAPDDDCHLADLRRARLDRFAAAALAGYTAALPGGPPETPESISRLADAAEALLAELERRELAAGEGGS